MSNRNVVPWCPMAWRSAPLFLLAGVLTACAQPPEAEPEEAAHEPIITLTVAQFEAAGIEVVPVERRPLANLIEATAVVEAEPDRTAQLAARVVGRVVSARVNEGDMVERGALLATIEAPELGQAKADFLGALAEETLADQTLARERRLFADRISAERSLREAERAAIGTAARREAAEARLHLLGLSDADLEVLRDEKHYDSAVEIRSPLRGIVTHRAATVGETVEATAPLFTVMDLDRVWIQAEVYETQLAALRPGQSVQIRTGAYPDQVATGQVEQVGSTVDRATRTVKVRIVTANPGHLLKPGMFASVTVDGGPAGAPMLVVPRASLQQDGASSVVFIALGDRRYERRVVQVEAESGDWIGIRAGLEPGDQVVTRGAFTLKAEFRRAELGEGSEH